MLLFFDFDRLLYRHMVCEAEPAARLARVLDEFPSVELVMIRWAVGTIRTLDDMHREVPELGERIRHLAHRPVRSDVLREREISGTLRKLRQLYWAAVVHERLAGGYISMSQSSGAPLVLCRNGFNDEAVQRLRLALALALALAHVTRNEQLVSTDYGFRKEVACAS